MYRYNICIHNTYFEHKSILRINQSPWIMHSDPTYFEYWRRCRLQSSFMYYPIVFLLWTGTSKIVKSPHDINLRERVSQQYSRLSDLHNYTHMLPRRLYHCKAVGKTCAANIIRSLQTEETLE